MPDAIPTLPGGNYTAIRDVDGTWCIKNIPIFSEVPAGERGNEEAIDSEWMRACVENMHRRHAEKYVAPVHVNHHDKPTEQAGYFLPVAVRPYKYEGRDVWTIYADLYKVPDHIYRRVRENRLAFRSVEVIKYEEREIGSLALMADEVPFFRYELTTIGVEIDHTGKAIGESRGEYDKSTPARAFRSCGRVRAHLFRFNDGGNMPEEKKQEEGKPGAGFPPGKQDEGEGKPEGNAGDGAPKPAAGPDTGTVAMFSEIKAMFAGLVALLSGNMPGAAGQNTGGLAPAAPVSQMRAAATPTEVDSLKRELATLAGSFAATNAKLAVRDAKETEDKQYATAIDELAGRPVTDEIKKSIRTFAAKPAGEFRAFLDAIKAALPIDPPLFAAFGASGSRPVPAEVPEEVMKLQTKGPQAYEQGLKMFRELEAHNSVPNVSAMDFERFQKIEKRRLEALNVPAPAFTTRN